MPEQSSRFPRPDFDRLGEAIKGLFPIKSRDKELDLVSVEPVISVTPEDTIEQVDAKLHGKTFGNKIVGEFVLKQGGKQIDRKKVNLLTIPELTNTLSYIVGGNDYQVPLQLRLKPNVYYEQMKTGDYRAWFNTDKGKSFSVRMDPESKSVYIDAGPKIGIYPVLKLLGMDDSKIRAELGEDIYKAISKVNSDKELAKAARSFLYKEKYSDESHDKLRKYFASGTGLGNGVKEKLGVGTTAITAQTLVNATKGLLGVYRGERKLDDVRDLKNNTINGVDDFLVERIKLRAPAQQYKSKISRKLSFKDKISDIVMPISPQVLSFFKNDDTGIVQYAKQNNPVSAFSDASRVVLTGAGAIRDPHQVTLDVRNVHPSTYGYLDPVATPDNHKAGVSLYLGAATSKRGKDLVSPHYNVKKKKMENLSPEEVSGKVVTTHDEYGDKSKKKLLAFKNGEFVQVARNDVDYILSPTQVFSLATLMTPFLSSNQGNRAMMAGKMVSQALPLAYPDEPLVKVKTPEIGVALEDIVGQGSSHSSPVDGTVVSVTTKDLGTVVTVKGAGGKKHKVQFASIYPFNDNTYMSETPIVKPGDTVKKGQAVSKTNFTNAKGVLTLGRNLKVGYMPYFSSTYEDSVAVSESAAKKLTSQHMYAYEIDKEDLVGKGKFMSYFSGAFKKDDASHIDSRGVPEVGSVIKPGMPLYFAARKITPSPIHKKLAAVDKRFARPFMDRAVTWEKESDGVVTKVVDGPKKVVVYVRNDSPAQVGDKLVSRNANKGIISEVIPDDQMPRGEDGQPLDILMNPVGIPSRMNVGQVHETMTSKVAKKLGKSIEVPQFQADNYGYVKKLMKDNGISDTEMVVDPATSKKSKVLTGYQYMYKLNHPVEKKFSIRQRQGYSVDQRPLKVSGSKTGAKGMGGMEIYALMAHGADNFMEDVIRRSSADPGFWGAFESGMPIPKPKPTFINQQFMGYLRAAGVNVDDSGDDIKFSPMLDRDVDNIAAGVIKNPLALKAKTLAPEKGGLFDDSVTGGVMGSRWGKIELKAPVVHPLYRDFVNNVIKFVGADPSKMTGTEIKDLLSRVDIDKALSNMRTKIKSTKSPSAGLIKAAKALRAAKAHGVKLENFVITKVPVLPPIFRPVYPLPDGSLEESPVNKAYKNLLMVNEVDPKYMSSAEKKEYDRQLQDAVDVVVGMHDVKDGDYRSARGAISSIKGARNKYGLFQGKVLKKRLDYSGLSVITPDYKLGMNEVGLPEDMAWGLYSPHIMRKMVSMGYKPTDVKEMIEKRDRVAARTLDSIMSETPAVLNRAPTLHKFSMLSFFPRIVPGKAIRTNPLINEGYNLDHDGDSIIGSLLCRDLDGNITHKDIKSLDGGKSVCKLDGGVEQKSVDGTVEVLSDKYEFIQPSAFSVHKLCNIAHLETFCGRKLGVSCDNSLWGYNQNLDVLRTNPWVGMPVKVDVSWPVKPCRSVMTVEEAYQHGVKTCTGRKEDHVFNAPDSCLFGEHEIRRAFAAGVLDGLGANRGELRSYRRGMWLVDYALRSIGIVPAFERVEGKAKTATLRLKLNRDNMAGVLGLSVNDHTRRLLGGCFIDWQVPVPQFMYDILAENGFGDFVGRHSMSASDAIDVVDCVCSTDERYLKWVEIASDPSAYDHITRIEVASNKGEAYDITVDDKIFVAGSGIRVWDTMIVHVPVTEAGRKDALKMLPTANIINPRTNDIINTITNEGVVTLHMLAKPGQEKKLKFKTLSDADKAYEEGKIKYDDVVKIGKTKTTLGRALIRKALPSKDRKSPIPTDKKGWNKYFRELAKGPASQYHDTINQLKDIAFGKTLDVGFSLSYDDFKPLESIEKETRRYENMPKSKIEPVLNRISRGYDKRIRAISNDNHLALMSNVGAKGNVNNLRQILGAPVSVKDIEDKTVPVFIGGNYSRGLKLSSYLATTPGVRKGIIDRALMTAEPGALAKKLVASAFSTVVTMDDCGTTDGIHVGLAVDMVDRYLASPQHGYRAGTLITPSIAANIERKGGAKVRSPITCKAESGVCKKCYGVHYGGRLPDLGDNVGVQAGHALSEPSTQLTMKTFHTGGSGGDKSITSGFVRLSQLLNLPKRTPSQAVLSPVGGKVSAVTKDVSGGHYVKINKDKFFIPPTLAPSVKRGQNVKPGDRLSVGDVNAFDVLEYSGHDKAVDFLRNEIVNQYKISGVDMRSRPVETIIRNMSGLYEVVDPGKSDFLAGELVTHSDVKKGMKVKPVLKGVGMSIPAGKSDLFERLSFQRLTDAIREAGQEYQTSKTYMSPLSTYVTERDIAKRRSKLSERAARREI